MIRAYTLLGPEGFERALDRLVTEVLAPLPNAGAFRVAGASHTMLGAPGEVEGLLAWLRAARARDPGWSSRGP